MSKQESGELWKRYLAGEGEALEALMKGHYTLLVQYGKKFTPDIHLIQDCIQHIFLSLWKNRSNINDTPSVSHYLLKALRNKLQRELFKNKSPILIDAGALEFRNTLQAELSPEARMILEEQTCQLAEKVREGIASLSGRQQEIIYLRFYLNATSSEISEIMGISRQSVYNLLNEAIARLRTIGEAHFKTILSCAVLFIAGSFLF